MMIALFYTYTQAFCIVKNGGGDYDE